MKFKHFIGSIFVLLAMLAVSCKTTLYDKDQDSNVDAQVQAKTEQAMEEANRQVGMPNIINFQEKKVMKEIYELRDQEALVCYAYLFNKMTGQIGQYLGRCIGYGLPYSTQFSNPEKFGTVEGGEYGAVNPYTMPQPEPNGLFMPEGLSATWLLLIDPETKEPRPVYVEPEIIVSPFKLH
jgi:hypothetical protein